MPRYRTHLQRIAGFISRHVRGRRPASAPGIAATPNPRGCWLQSRAAAFGYVLTALLLCLVAVLADRLEARFEVAGIPAGLFFASVLLPLGLWALAMWHEALQRRIDLKNRMDEAI